MTKRRDDDPQLEMLAPIQQLELRGLLLLAQGKTNERFVEISAAAKAEREFRVSDFDPPTTGRIIFNVLGREYLKHGLPAEARQAFEQALQAVPNDAVALAGLIQAHHALTQDGKAAEYFARTEARTCYSCFTSEKSARIAWSNS